MAAKTKPSEVDHKGMTRIFVYGSLKRDHPNNTLLERAKATFLGYDSIRGHYQMISLSAFPAVIQLDHKSPECTIYGQVYGTDEKGLRAVDFLEGHPDWYNRQKVWTQGLTGALEDRKRVWVYLMPPAWMEETDAIVDSGIWHPHSQEENFWKSRGVKFA